MNAAPCEPRLPAGSGIPLAVAVSWAVASAVLLFGNGPARAGALPPAGLAPHSRALGAVLHRASDFGINIVRMPPRPNATAPGTGTSALAPPPQIVTPPVPPPPNQPPAPQGRLVKLTVRLGAQPREPEKGWLGVQMDGLELPLALSLGLPNANGVLVLEAVASGPAAQAGVGLGDIIVGLNGRPVTQMGELRQRLAAMAPGSDVELELWRIAEGDDFLQTLRRLGEGGNAYVMFRLGRLYANGIGVARDDIEAVRWYRMGASAGNLNATTALAMALIEGRGATKDEREGLRLLRAAAEKDNHEALHWLGVILGQGKLLSKDTTEAIRLLTRAAEAGHVPSMLDLASLYNSAEGGAADPVKAAFWYKRAADLGNSAGMVNLGFMHQQGKGVEHNDITAVALYRRAAAEGNSTGIHNLAAMLDSGRGVPRKDPEQAADLILRALEMRNEFSYKQMTQNSRAWSLEFRRALQRKLQTAGVYSGRIDGELRDTTITAINAYINRTR